MKEMEMKSRSRIRGFSLVEVTIAMAIAALAIVTLLGMIPQGMKTLQEAGDRAIMGRIHQGILSEIQLTPFGTTGVTTDLIDSFNGTERFYDNQGERLIPDAGIPGRATVGEIRELFSHLYSARIHISGPGVKIPRSIGIGDLNGQKFGGSDLNKNVKTVIVEVAAVGGKDKQSNPFDWNDGKNFSLIKTYQTIVVKTGRDYD